MFKWLGEKIENTVGITQLIPVSPKLDYESFQKFIPGNRDVGSDSPMLQKRTFHNKGTIWTYITQTFLDHNCVSVTLERNLPHKFDN